MLRAENLQKAYGDVRVLNGVSIELCAGEMVALKGASGAGKSTLLHLLGTLDVPDAGAVFFEDTALHTLTDNARAHFRNRALGFVFQFHHLLPEFTALENVFLPALVAGVSKKEARQRAQALLEEVGLGERHHHKPAALSGGEQQRVAVARALVNRPAILLADEPTGNLDSTTGTALIGLLRKQVEERNLGVLVVTHSDSVATAADRRLSMQDGQLRAA